MTKRMILMVALFSVGAVACDDGGESIEAGPSTVCAAGDTCNNDCMGNDSACNMTCPAQATCTAVCRTGQTCNFTCEVGASCDFDCANGACQVTGAHAGCSCSGNCTGTCGDGGGGDPCLDACGAASDPGYAACIAACG